jgi:hypothetical protein
MEKSNLPVNQEKMNVVSSFNFFDPVQFETMQRVCKMFASSELVPDMYKSSKDNPIEKAMANCMIAIEIAQRIGASPLMIMQNMVPIYGHPAWSSKFLIATVNTCGRFNPLQFKFTVLGNLGKIDYVEYVYNPAIKKKEPVKKEFDGTKIENLQCIAFTNAKGAKDILESSPVDLKLAVQEGWYNKNGSKWQTMTKQMLIYRAASFWTNAYAPELSMGMKTREELEDIEDVIDIPYVDISEKVNAEKVVNANKKNINIDEKQADAVDKKQDDKKVNENPNKITESKNPPF